MAPQTFMRTLLVLTPLLWSAPLCTVAITPGAGAATQPSAAALAKTRMELEPSGQLVDVARPGSDLVPQVMRRHETALTAAETLPAAPDASVAPHGHGEASLLDGGLAHAPAGGAAAPTRSASLEERRNAGSAASSGGRARREDDDADDADAEAARPSRAAEAPYSGVQALKGLMPGPIPESQKPAFAGCLFLLFAAGGFLAYHLYQQWAKGKESENQALLRRRMERMRALAAAAEARLPPPRSEDRPPKLGADDQPEGPPPKGFGKGPGGKVGGRAGGKASGKGGAKGAPQPRGPARAGPPPALLAEAAGLGLGQKGSAGSVSSRAETTETAPAASEVCADAPEKAGVLDSKAGAQKPKASGKGSGGKVNDTKLQDLLSMLRAAERIQGAWRRWKALQKLPAANQRITLVCDVLEGADMPNVNRFGGCDPFIECRVVRGDPTHRLRGDVDKAPLLAAQTEVKRNDLAPRWEQRLALPGLAYERGTYVQLVLWDYSIVRSTPVGHVALPLEQALARRPMRAMHLSPLPGGDAIELKTTVSAKFSFWETYRQRLIVVGGSWLPKVKMVGTISGYVEARVLRSDPRKAPFVPRPSSPAECLWSGRTGVVGDSVDPSWEQEFEFELSCDVASLWLQLVLWDANPPHPDQPVGHAVVRLLQAVQPSPRGDLVDHQLRLEELPGRHVAVDLSRAELAVRLGCEPVMGAEQDL